MTERRHSVIVTLATTNTTVLDKWSMHLPAGREAIKIRTKTTTSFYLFIAIATTTARMSSLSYFLDRIDKSVDILLGLEFSAPGMFTNAIINKPKINKLLKDVEGDEGALFRVIPANNSLEATFPEKHIVRIDGKSIYEDTNNQDSKTIVPIPQLNMQVLNTNEIQRDDLEEFLIDNDIDQLCSSVYSIIDKYPTLVDNYQQIKIDVGSYQKQFHQLKQEINDLQQAIDQQKQSLIQINNDYSPSKRSRLSSDDNLDEAIANEEKEIKELEYQLNIAQDT